MTWNSQLDSFIQQSVDPQIENLLWHRIQIWAKNATFGKIVFHLLAIFEDSFVFLQIIKLPNLAFFVISSFYMANIVQIIYPSGHTSYLVASRENLKFEID